MKIPTMEDEITFKVEPYRQSGVQMDFLIGQIPLMEARGLIGKCHNATGYTSLLVVKKPGGQWACAMENRP